MKKFYSAERFQGHPSNHVCIRHIDKDDFQIIDVQSNLEIETVERSRATYSLHPGAIYIHQGQSYCILSADYESCVAKAQPINCSYITRPRQSLYVYPNHATIVTRVMPKLNISFGAIECKTMILGYTKIDPLSKKKVEYIAMETKTCFKSQGWGIWIDGNRSAWVF
jgi:DEAD/DEAH box helicase domain-containing protein